MLVCTLSLSTACAQSQCDAADLSCNAFALLLYQTPNDPDCLVRGQVPSEGWGGFAGTAVDDSFGQDVCGLPDGRIAFVGQFNENIPTYQGIAPRRPHLGGGAGDIGLFITDEFGRLERYGFFGNPGTSHSNLKLAVAPDGSIYVIGNASGPIPSIDGQDPIVDHQGGNDIVVLKLTAELGLIWYRYIGGAGNQSARSVVVAADGSLLVGGESNSDHAFDGLTPLNAYNASLDATLYRLSADGGALWYSFVGSAAADSVPSVRRMNLEARANQSEFVDQFVVGLTVGGDVPALQGLAPERAYAGGNDIAVLRLRRSGELIGYGFYGGPGNQAAVAALGLRSGEIFISGTTDEDLPVLDGVARGGDGLIGGTDAWLLRLNNSGAIQQHRIVGSTGADSFSAALETPSGDVWVVGSLPANGLDALAPFPNAGLTDYAVIRLSPANELLRLAYYGSANNESGNGGAPTVDGGLVFTGESSLDFSFPEAATKYDPAVGGGNGSAFFGRVFANGRTVP